MCPCVPSFAKAQFAYADSLAAAGQYDAARLAYERVAYVATDPALRNWAWLHKARLYKQDGAYGAAQRTLERTNAFAGSDSLRFLLTYETALVAYLRQDWQAARIAAQQSRYWLSGTPYSNGTLHLELMALHAERRWEEAQQLLAAQGALAGWHIDADSLYGSFPKLKDLDKAEWLHLFLPGTGQMYAGYFGEGAVSSVMTLGAVGFTLFQAWKGYYALAAFGGAGIFYAFYTGGLRYTGYLVEERNKKVVAAYNRKLNQEILKAVERLRVGAGDK